MPKHKSDETDAGYLTSERVAQTLVLVQTFIGLTDDDRKAVLAYAAQLHAGRRGN